MEKFVLTAEKGNFDLTLIEKLGELFDEESNQPNQAQYYRKFITKFFGHDKSLLEAAAKRLGFWYKDMGEDEPVLLSFSLSKEQLEKYGLKINK